MYLIENGRGYSIKDDKAYKITFGIDGKMKIDEEDFIEVEGKTRYTYNELMAKLNVKYMLEQAKLKAGKKQDESEELKALKEENEQLLNENEAYKEKIAELELELEELKKLPEEDEVKEDEQPKEEKENKKK